MRMYQVTASRQVTHIIMSLYNSKHEWVPERKIIVSLKKMKGKDKSYIEPNLCLKHWKCWAMPRILTDKKGDKKDGES